MKRVSFLTRLSLVSTLLGVLSTCGGDGSPPTDPGGNGEPPDPVLTSIVVSPSPSTLSAIDQTLQLTAVARDQDGENMSGATFSWSSSDEAVASVTSAGLVRAAGPGQTTIRVTSGSVSGMAAVSVQQVVAAVVVSPPDMALTEVGEVQQFIAEATDANGHPITDITFLWLSSDPTVATVSTTGLVTAVAEGQAMITAATGEHEGSAYLAVDLENVAPLVTIGSPADGSAYSSGETVSFEGSAEDPEDGTLSGASLIWTSSLDGQIGTGSSFGRDDLSVGSHTVSLSATDSEGATAVSMVSIGIDAPPNQPPSATITAPVDGSTVLTGEVISFQGGGTDPEDGSLTGSQLVWTSDLDGQIGTGAGFTRSNLAIGDHSITLTATDSDGATGTASVDLTVQPVPVGAIELTVSSVGQDIPSNYAVVLDGSTSETVGSNGSTTFSDLVPGTYSLELTGLTQNCQVAGDNPVSVTVTAATTTAVTMSVACRALVGTIRVVAETTGELDPDGYLVSLDGGSAQSLPVNGSVSFQDVPEGSHQVALSDLASNCTLAGSSVRNVDVLDGQTTEEVFAVTCEWTSHIAFTSGRDGDYEVYVMNPDGTGLINLTNNAASDIGSSWSPDGNRVAFRRNGDIYVVDRVQGGETRLTYDPATDRGPAWSPDGSRIAFMSFRTGYSDVFVARPDGTGLVNLTNSPSDDDEVSWSPDGSQVIFSSNRTGNYELFVINADGTGLTNLTNSPARDGTPAWSPDGLHIAFWSDRDGNGLVGNGDLYLMDADGSNVVRLTVDPENSSAPVWSPDGTRIAFTREQGSFYEIYVMTPSGSGTTRLTNTSGDNDFPRWSPDGKRIVFHSTRTGDNEIFVMDADGSNQFNLTNSAGLDGFPVWSP